MTSTTLQWIQREVQKEYNKQLEKMPFAERPATSDVLMSIIENITHLTAFAARGRHTFMLRPGLIQMLENTNLADIRLDDINLPFKAFYLSFGEGLKFGLPGPQNIIDGAYIQILPKSEDYDTLSFYITSRRTDAQFKGAHKWIKGSEQHFFTPLKVYPNDTLEDALNRAIEDKDILLEPSQDLNDNLKNTVQAAQDEGLDVSLPSKSGFDREAEFNKAALPEMKQVLALITNALCYLTAFPEDQTPDWPDGAASSLISKTIEGTPKSRRSAVAGLLNNGFMQIKVIGANLQKSNNHKNETSSENISKTEISSHWRRGHWRRQAHGPGHSERSLKWIKPTLVRSDKEAPELHTVYLVDAPDQ